MIRRYAAAALAAGTLVAAWPAQAAAKGVPGSVRLCGPSACVRIADPAVRLALARIEGRPESPAPALAPYLRLTTRPPLFGLAGYLVPAQGVVVLGAGSHRLGPQVLSIVRSGLAAIAPYRPQVGHVWVGGRAASERAAYAAILRGRPVAPPPAIWRTRSMSIAISVGGPWAGWDSARYFPAGRLLHAPDGTWLRVPPAQAAMIAAAARPIRTVRGGGSARPLAIVLAACAVLAACVAGLRPRRRLRGAWFLSDDVGEARFRREQHDFDALFRATMPRSSATWPPGWGRARRPRTSHPRCSARPGGARPDCAGGAGRCSVRRRRPGDGPKRRRLPDPRAARRPRAARGARGEGIHAPR